MDEPNWKYRGYVVYATFSKEGEEGGVERRFAYDARYDEEWEPRVDWRDDLHWGCVLHDGNAAEAVAVAELHRATDITVRHVEIGASVTPEELLKFRRQELVRRQDLRRNDLMLFVGLTAEDVALL